MSALDLPAGGRRYLRIAQQLADDINMGRYRAGERLPPERDLATSLGVSRTTLWRRMRRLGMVDDRSVSASVARSPQR